MERVRAHAGVERDVGAAARGAPQEGGGRVADAGGEREEGGRQDAVLGHAAARGAAAV